jgi:hypothetical protein
MMTQMFAKHGAEKMGMGGVSTNFSLHNIRIFGAIQKIYFGICGSEFYTSNVDAVKLLQKFFPFSYIYIYTSICIYI